MSDATILLGYEIGSGRELRIPVRHMAVTGITQMSGKTTTLEALIRRSGRCAVTFVTKRGEGSFQGEAHRLAPMLMQQGCDWQTVTELLEAHLGERLSKSLRPHLMLACDAPVDCREYIVNPSPSEPVKNRDLYDRKKPSTLQELRAVLLRMEAESESKSDERAYYTLASYVRGFLESLPLGTIAGVDTTLVKALPAAFDGVLDLQPGLNIMDLSGLSPELQGIAIGATLDAINRSHRGVIVLVPEAWQFIPREGRTACKSAIMRMCRQGACLENFVWVDTQNLASIDIDVRNQLSVYLLGVQRQFTEVKRTLAHMPSSHRKPTPANIMELDRGMFWMSYDHELRCCYVQPTWLDDDPERAKRFAMEPLGMDYVAPPKRNKKASQKEAIQ